MPIVAWGSCLVRGLHAVTPRPFTPYRSDAAALILVPTGWRASRPLPFGREVVIAPALA